MEKNWQVFVESKTGKTSIRTSYQGNLDEEDNERTCQDEWRKEKHSCAQAYQHPLFIFRKGRRAYTKRISLPWVMGHLAKEMTQRTLGRGEMPVLIDRNRGRKDSQASEGAPKQGISLEQWVESSRRQVERV